MDFKKLKESQHVECKSSFTKEVIISLVAFANTKGGKVVIGVNDKGKISGIEIGTETEQRYLNEIKTATYPQIIPHSDIYEIDGKTVLVFVINEYPVKPVAYKNRYYKRVRNSNHLLALDEIVDLQQQSLDVSYDAYPLDEEMSSLGNDLIEDFAEKVNSRGRINLRDDIFTNLKKLKMVKSGKPTLAAMLLFGNHGYTIHIGRFKAEDTIIDDLLIKAPLLTAVEEAMTFIKKHINLSYEFDGSLERIEKWQYPLEGLRELLLNSVVHRDYKSASDVVIKIFDDRIIFTNPGTLYGSLTFKDLERNDYVSSIRNKLLAEAFYLTGDIEKYGTGFVRIRKMLKEYPELTFKMDEAGDFFRVNLLQVSSKEGDLPGDEGISEGINEGITRLVQYIEKYPGNRAPEISKALKVPGKTLERWIKTAREKGLIEFRGSKKTGGYYEITK